MLIVPVNNDRNSNEKALEIALKTLKYKIQKTGLIKELRQRSEFVKPSDSRRKILTKAKYVQKLKENFS